MREFLDLVDLIYAAALEPNGWPRALESLSAMLSADGASLVAQDRRTHRMDGAVTGGHVEALRAYGDYYGRINPVWPPTHVAPAGAVLIDRAIVEPYAYERTEYFNDFCIPYGFHSAIAAKVVNDRAATAVVTLSRGAGKPSFDQADSELLFGLTSHLQRAVEVSRRLSHATALASGLEPTLQALSQPAILTDATGLIVFANTAAQQLLSAEDGLASDTNGIKADTPAMTQTLRHVIGLAAASFSPVVAPLQLVRRSGRRPLVVRIVPCRPDGAARDGWRLLATATALVLLVIADADRTPLSPIALLRHRYRLTVAEASLAIAVAEGRGLRVVAESLHITVATAKTHLQRVFDKTDTHRQAELGRLVTCLVSETNSGNDRN